jgi:hypothetical protein
MTFLALFSCNSWHLPGSAILPFFTTVHKLPVYFHLSCHLGRKDEFSEDTYLCLVEDLRNLFFQIISISPLPLLHVFMVPIQAAIITMKILNTPLLRLGEDR